MAVLIDPPMWPAHGTLWSHLVSDTGYDELHGFARRLALPRRSFDLDHYDVPAASYDRAVALGAVPVGAKEVVHRLRAAGLRVRQAERATQTPVRRRQYLVAEWESLGAELGVGADAATATAWHGLGVELIGRWNEPHRRYHDERHLEDVLLALDHLAVRGERLQPATLLAAWFHDAVYSGRGGDESDSARLAVTALAPFGFGDGLVSLVGDLITATVPTRELAAPQTPAAHLLDADLAIFASPAHRYDEYSASVRLEYAHVPEPLFATARADILAGYLERAAIYRTTTAQQLWEARARGNLAREIAMLRAPG